MRSEDVMLTCLILLDIFPHHCPIMYAQDYIRGGGDHIIKIKPRQESFSEEVGKHKRQFLIAIQKV